ncbi:transcriptional regulator, MerR family [Formosa sp. Hel3_A1_48]|jgi:DNA-binding transcriptional MerR regulator|uniref:MerR family transcriptional regulator n=1 Tax=Formosa sp. Hel3_A1_48 TaxID=1336795 RepID=UPI00084E2237|nr:MerR family transcriptional regulator [Formosa sp. Hel3_A1_48]AOR25771.1 transcriptional regulator, MerR family [Formosa sp. Hel3_A1_48]MDC0950636.1 MerR family transcriptional regulator [Flavobacteriaceae bacterium]MDG2483538.1 MerR family transcriptional regulator [Flavobacteriaceae bacterium]NCF41454.1 MerR family transcriptional regulator [Bacteroidota bacterium]|tara:strand:+ start:83 stop:982 length:900 start_codon:yes stop_codon:yes gene_type:complete
MNSTEHVFSIKDLENLSGVKAHTIRIWEKRYNLLKPKRSKTNIRHYDLNNLQKLLNISFLNSNGFKISKIAALDETELAPKTRELAFMGKNDSQAIVAFKLAMLNFDQILFYNTYNSLLEEKSFRTIFYEVFIPLLFDLGMLWQTNTISPSHEHFLTVHIKQKILVHIERLQSTDPRPSTKTVVLFLPENETHDLGLLFINYEILSLGYHTIFLGENIPLNNLKYINKLYDDIIYISYFTIKPSDNEIHNYLKIFSEEYLSVNKNSAKLIGHRIRNLNPENVPKNIMLYDKIEDLVKDL